MRATSSWARRRASESAASTSAIERIDELIIGPMLAGLGALGDFTILLMPDHATPSQLKTHSSEPVPFALLKSSQLKSAGATANLGTISITVP